MPIKKILILSASTSENYIRIPQSLKLCAENRFPDIEVICIDTIKYVSNFFKKIYADNYIEIVKKHPALWGYIYDKVDNAKKIPKIPESRFIFQDFFSSKLKEKIIEIKPDFIISTHFLPSEQLNKLKDEKYAEKYCSVVTDYDVHWLWVQARIDLFCVATSEAAERLMQRGIPKERIKVTGIPISPRCLEKNNHNEILNEYSLSETKFKIFILDSGYGIGPAEYIAEEILLNNKKDIQIIVYESDKADKEKFNDLLEKYPDDIRICPNSHRIEKLLSVSNLVIASPNGYACAECMAMGKPIISINPIPGNEERNSDYLIENGAGLKVYDLTGLLYRINKLKEDSSLLERMRNQALSISKPDSAYEILNSLIKMDNNLGV